MTAIDDLRVGQALIEGQIAAGAIITLEEAARRLGVTRQMVRKMAVYQGKAYHMTYARKVYVSAADIEKLKLRDTKPGRKKSKAR